MSASYARVALIGALAIVPANAAADPRTEARQHIERASSLHAAGNYNDALKEITIAYSLDPQPQLLYAIGQLHVKLDNCEEATTFYRRFLATGPDERDASLGQQAIAHCATRIAPRPALTMEPLSSEPPLPPPPPRIASEDSIRAHAPPRGRDWLGWSLVGGGVATGVVGAFYYRAALVSRDDADKATTYEIYDDRLRDTHRRRTTSYVLGGGAALLAGAGVLHILLRDDSEHPVAVIPDRGGMLATWRGRF